MGELIEIKGDHLITDTGELIDRYYKGKAIISGKQNCIKQNNVKIYRRKDIKFAIDYVEQVYGKNYLKKFKK